MLDTPAQRTVQLSRALVETKSGYNPECDLNSNLLSLAGCEYTWAPCAHVKGVAFLRAGTTQVLDLDQRNESGKRSKEKLTICNKFARPTSTTGRKSVNDTNSENHA